MKDNVLKKQFQKRDVERLRNLVKGKHGDRTTVGIGYNGENSKIRRVRFIANSKVTLDRTC